jgi:hypothetical protein
LSAYSIRHKPLPSTFASKLKILDALKEARSSAVRNTTIAPGLLNTVPRRVETPNKSLGLYSLTDPGQEASELQ